MNPIHLSVIIPAYNEEHRIAPTVRAIAGYLLNEKYSSEIIVVLNNCTDSTALVVESLQKEIPLLRYVDLGMIAHPSGTKGLAVKKGMLEAKGEYCIYVDADNAAKIGEIQKLWPFAEDGVEVVFGSRYVDGSKAKVSKYRRMLSRMANVAVQGLLLPGVHDTQCAFKLFTASAANDIFYRSRILGWGFDMEALYLARHLGFRMQEVAIVWEEMGGSSVKPKAFLDSFKDLISIRLRAWKGEY